MGSARVSFQSYLITIKRRFERINFLTIFSHIRYYFSTFEDDSLLCLLDDDAYSKDEQKIKVIPEDVNIKINEDVLDSIIKELKM